MSRNRIVFILGATGTGKSKLAVQIAKKFNGEVISADSMQVYKGLDITSNKISETEKENVPHYMLDILTPMSRFTSTDYRNRTLSIIEDILNRRKLPIIVGGTNYYIESLLWDVLVEKPKSNNQLVFERQTVLRRVDKMAKWKSYSGSGRQKDADDEKSDSPEAESSESPDKSNLNLHNISKRIAQFGRTLESVTDDIRIPFTLYRRTFYRYSVNEPLMSAGYYNNVDENDSESEKALDDEGEFDVVSTELELMNRYVRNCLRQVVRFNKQKELGEAEIDSATALPHFYHFWNLNSVAQLMLDRSFHQTSNPNYSDDMLQLPEQLLKDIYDNVCLIAELRSRRLKLIRIVDDEAVVNFNTFELIDELLLVDPVTAENMHPNNRRKIIRALQVYMQYGQKLSCILEKQKEVEGGSLLGGPLRFPNACILWLRCDQVIEEIKSDEESEAPILSRVMLMEGKCSDWRALHVKGGLLATVYDRSYKPQDYLDDRLDSRVDEMIKNGMINELLEFHKQYNIARLKMNVDRDYTKGIFQSIGLKEFHNYLILDEEERNGERGQKMLVEGIKHLKIATKRFSKYQVRWILNKFIRRPENVVVPPIFELDASEFKSWEETEQLAFSIVEHYAATGDPHRVPHDSIPIEAPHPNRFTGGKYRCDICERVFVGQYQWQIHCGSRKHMRMIYKSNVKALRKKMAALHSNDNVAARCEENS